MLGMALAKLLTIKHLQYLDTECAKTPSWSYHMMFNICKSQKVSLVFVLIFFKEGRVCKFHLDRLI